MPRIRSPFELPTLSDLEDKPSVWVVRADMTFCRFCGIKKDATTGRFFVDHYRECIRPHEEEAGKTSAFAEDD